MAMAYTVYVELNGGIPKKETVHTMASARRTAKEWSEDPAISPRFVAIMHAGVNIEHWQKGKKAM